MSTRFTRYIGIDYSGAETPNSRLKGLRVYEAVRDAPPSRIDPPAAGARNWTRREIAQFCQSALEGDEPLIIGIDHAFGFPASYLQRHSIKTWDQFLDDFMRHWPTADPHVYVESFREGNLRTGKADELRLCERWTAGAKSVFRFDVQGAVAKSTHSGLPWILWLRRMPNAKERAHFWPFDGFEIPAKKSVVTEVYPALLNRRYPRGKGRTADEHDAWSVATWLQEMDRRGTLSYYYRPPLTLPEQRQAQIEGWILGVC